MPRACCSGAGHDVEVLLLWPADELSDDAAANLERLDGGWRELREGEAESALAGSGAIVDAIFGTGFDGAPREPAASAIEAANESWAPIVACDVASGVDASTGEAEGAAIDADLTVSFHAAKVGHRVAPGKWRTGRLSVVPIGIPAGPPSEPAAGVIGPAALELPPRRGQESTKFSSGEVLVVGGSRGLTGAVCMASLAATRAGAGYATVAVPDSLEPILEAKLTEVMTVGLESLDGGIAAAAASEVLQRAERASCVVLGPGMGRAEHSANLARELIGRIPAPLLIDADGLNALGTDLSLLSGRKQPTILTPHAGELGRLLGCPSEDVNAARLACAKRAAAESRRRGRAEGRRHARRRGRPGRGQRPRQPGAGDRRHRRRALRARSRPSSPAGPTPSRPPAPASTAMRRAGREAARRIGTVESVIAGDVIEALPRGLRP